ncbi:MAG: hypothetical protein DRQ55_08870 [Planctomycetota bacterium]|nr:MAG: hypothetical protein DRQ55_08870 [Planctomycetota bacterium]
MTSKTNFWKLGLFISSGVAVGLGTLLWLGASTLYQEKYRVHAFFDESVHGLDVGSPVKYRGVTVGTVADIGFAPDQTTVVVDMDIFLGALESADLERDGGARRDISFAVQITSAGITGGKYIAADEFPVDRYPRVKIPAELPEGIDDDEIFPAVTSSLKNFEETIYELAETLPGMFDNVDILIEQLSELSTTIHGLAQGEVRDVLTRLVDQLDELDVQGISDGITASLDELTPTLVNVREVTARLNQEDGPLATLIDDLTTLIDHANQAVIDADVAGVRAEVSQTLDSTNQLALGAGALTRDARLVSEEARITIAELRQTLHALTRVLELLEREPSSLLRGRDDPPSAPDSAPQAAAPRTN